MLPKTENIYPSSSVDRKHLIHFHSGKVVFKILLRSVDDALKMLSVFSIPSVKFSDQTPNSQTLRGAAWPSG